MRDEFARALRSPTIAEAAILLAHVELPTDTDPLNLWAAFPDRLSAFFEDADETIVGSGICCRVAPDTGSADPLARLRDAIGLSGESRGPTPRLLGTQPFAPDWFDQRWVSLTNQGFVLPLWTILRTPDQVSLQLAVDGPIDHERTTEIGIGHPLSHPHQIAREVRL